MTTTDGDASRARSSLSAASSAEASQSHSQTQHVPVLPTEVLELLDPRPGQVIVDGTFGGGGHSRLLAERLGASGRLVAIDRDPAAIARGGQQPWPCPVEWYVGSYSELPSLLARSGRGPVHAILLDLGLSSDQLADADRGFSFRVDGPLDLRFNPDLGTPAWELLDRLPEKELADLIYRYGEERRSRRIARAIVQRRGSNPIRTARQLADVVRGCQRRAGHRARHSRRNSPELDPATRTFQALRIAVNQELQHLSDALECLPECLAEGGRLVVISFHSLEDRLVKHALKQDVRWEVLTRKPLTASEVERRENPRCRSAKLRAGQRRTDAKP